MDTQRITRAFGYAVLFILFCVCVIALLFFVVPSPSDNTVHQRLWYYSTYAIGFMLMWPTYFFGLVFPNSDCVSALAALDGADLCGLSLPALLATIITLVSVYMLLFYWWLALPNKNPLTRRSSGTAQKRAAP